MRINGCVSLRFSFHVAPRGNSKEEVFERPIIPEGTTHRTNDEAKDETTSDGTARLSEEKQSIPRPSIRAVTIVGSASTPKGRNRTLDEAACSIKWVDCFSSASPVRLVASSRSSLPKPKLQHTGPAPNRPRQGLHELTNLDDPLARDFPPRPIRYTEVLRIKTRLKISMIKLSKILEPPYSNGVPAPSAH
jgi:hypothetical protein